MRRGIDPVEDEGNREQTLILRGDPNPRSAPEAGRRSRARVDILNCDHLEALRFLPANGQAFQFRGFDDQSTNLSETCAICDMSNSKGECSDDDAENIKRKSTLPEYSKRLELFGTRA